MRNLYVCEDTVGGIFSAVYDAWKAGEKEDTCGIVFRGNVEEQLFCEYLESQASGKKAAAVERLIVKNLGMEVYSQIYHAALSRDLGKGDAILGTMLAARKLKDSTQIMNHLSHPMVEKVFELNRNVSGETHSYKGFLRFRELKNGILFSRIAPKNRILTCLAPHFADRLPVENWMIYDETHGEFVVHEAKKEWVLVSGEQVDLERLENVSDSELEFARLWKGFCRTISIEARENRLCQRQHLPLWQRKNMVEFDKNGRE